MAYPVEPFDFELVPHELPLPFLKCEFDCLRQHPDSFSQVADCLEDQFKYMHKVGFVLTHRGIQRVGSGLRRPLAEGAKPCISISTRLQLLA